MSLKTVSQISLAIVLLVFMVQLVQLVELCSYLLIDLDLVAMAELVYRVVDALLWLPFMLFFWKIMKDLKDNA